MEYAGTLDPDDQSISGQYSNGIINLRKKQGVRAGLTSPTVAPAESGEAQVRQPEFSRKARELQFRFEQRANRARSVPDPTLSGAAEGEGGGEPVRRHGAKRKPNWAESTLVIFPYE